MLIDTHAHIHAEDYPLDRDGVLQRAAQAGVEKVVCVGTDITSSRQAVEFAGRHQQCYPSVGLHPHHAERGQPALDQLADLVDANTTAIGECGLDYYYENSPKEAQKRALRFQIELAQEHDLLLIFHVRDQQHQPKTAFADLFDILDDYDDLRGVVHSFSSTPENLHRVLNHGLYAGFNGIMTFTDQADQLAAARDAPTDRILLETDAPYLTPVPNRGKVNEPANVELVAKFLADLRGESFDKFAKKTSQNALKLFRM